MEKVKFIRRNQTLSPFGVGAIMDIEGESLVAADITYWKGKGEEIHEPRLERLLSVRKFMMSQPAPDFQWQITESTPGIPFARFPTWLFCANCRRMYRRYSRFKAPTCPGCGSEKKLTPMRLVMACPRGHLADVPWVAWAHSNARGVRCEKPVLEFITEAGGSGLEFVHVRCRTCGERRSLYGIASQDSLRQIGTHCPGHHPWNAGNDRDSHCDAVPQVLQRGATNLTFSVIESSIDIPPYSTWDAYNSTVRVVTNNPLFSAVRSSYQSASKDFLNEITRLIADQTKLELKVVQSVIARELGSDDEPAVAPWDPDDLLVEEFAALSQPARAYDPRDNFIKNDVSLDSYPAGSGKTPYQESVSVLKETLGGISQVTRLREVRALRGFSRLAPCETQASDDEDEPAGRFHLYGTPKTIGTELVDADLKLLPRTERWLPAVEVFGEGIFLRLNEERLQAWEAQEQVVNRAIILVRQRNENARYLPVPTPRLVLLHTLAHLLIRQLSFECGYSIASLRERIYSQNPGEGQDPAAGILLYTAAGDAEGTLGGLVREGKVSRILPTMLKAIQSAEWCSSDPLCSESRGQGMFAMNLAACHACSLLPETSCTMSNRLLDRTMLLGNIDGTIPGFFTDVIKKIVSNQTL